jgi:hypothetical protein
MEIEVRGVEYGDFITVDAQSTGFCVLSASREITENGVHYITIELIPERRADARPEFKASDDSVPS